MFKIFNVNFDPPLHITFDEIKFLLFVERKGENRPDIFTYGQTGPNFSCSDRTGEVNK